MTREPRTQAHSRRRARTRAPWLARGMTLLETLAATCIVAVLLVGLAELTRTVRSLDARHLDHARWTASAEAVLQAIHDELVSGERPDRRDPVMGARVQVTDRSLAITIRMGRGEARVVAYRFDPEARRITRAVRELTQEQTDAVALGDVMHASFTLTGSALLVELESVRGVRASRRYAVPSEGA